MVCSETFSSEAPPRERTSPRARTRARSAQVKGTPSSSFSVYGFRRNRIKSRPFCEGTSCKEDGRGRTARLLQSAMIASSTRPRGLCEIRRGARAVLETWAWHRASPWAGGRRRSSRLRAIESTHGRGLRGKQDRELSYCRAAHLKWPRRRQTPAAPSWTRSRRFEGGLLSDRDPYSASP